MKKWIIVLIALIILIPFAILLIDYSRPDQEPFRAGDYVVFGTYLGDPVLWRVIDNDSSGDPLLLSEYIISLKAFDSKGPKYTDGMRMRYGSNCWSDSNLRQWLNSSSKKINWKMNEPSSENLLNGNNPYKDEAGFLSEENFTAPERRAIKQVTHRVTLCETDKGRKSGGSQPCFYDKSIDSIGNYDKAYYQMSADKVFLLSISELKACFVDRGWEYRAVPTEKAIARSTFKIPAKRSDNFWDYWLIDPQGTYSYYERVVLGNLEVDHAAAYMAEGVRPALYLDLSRVETKSGSGTLADPCVLEGRGLLSVFNGK